MAFLLNNVVPWGRNMQEYCAMFNISEKDKDKKMAGFGDGPASFNSEATKAGFNVTSFDPVYQFSKAELENRILEVRDIVMEQMAENRDNYVWKNIRDLEELDSDPSDMISDVIEHYRKNYDVEIQETGYEFQKGADKMLIIRRNALEDRDHEGKISGL